METKEVIEKLMDPIHLLIRARIRLKSNIDTCMRAACTGMYPCLKCKHDKELLEDIKQYLGNEDE